ncbi:hypothetical protein I3760_02G051400 [Carya illinoinensis]|nr:hypothetical protein I3760_02G051400 [Carya illinoinensis]
MDLPPPSLPLVAQHPRASMSLSFPSTGNSSAYLCPRHPSCFPHRPFRTRGRSSREPLVACLLPSPPIQLRR